MHLVISLLYAPLIFFALQRYEIQTIALTVFVCSILWMMIIKKEDKLSILFPLFYLIIAISAYFLETFLLLKSMPLIVSILFSIYLLISYLKKQSLILYFAKKFSSMSICEKEEEYIHNSTLFWFSITLLNVCIHLIILLSDNLELWLYYSSVGWYLLFLIAGVIQFTHRKFIFIKRKNV